ncbi:MAG: mismatch repair protein, partial [Acidobacteriaceae bacterium]
LLQWAEAPAKLRQVWLRWVAPLLMVLAVGATTVWAEWGTFLPLLVVIIVEASLARWLKKRLLGIFSSAESTFENVDLLSALLARLEREEFRSARLQALQAALTSHALKGSDAIARLGTVVDLINSRGNFIVMIFDLPLMYSVQVAMKAEAWRAQHGVAVRGWLDATGEMEALLSLSAYHYEHPADPFPEFVEGAACLEGEALGHPLLAAAKCVRNDLKLDAETRAILVSGSNMSGKSTYLRTVGVNTVLAMAGAPVRARRLRLTPLTIGASIQMNDSLQEGSSRFYAEITRLRTIYDMAAAMPPLLFLLDELLQGTNSKDRRIGAEGVLRGLLERGAIGIVTTHDLALTELEGLPEGAIENMHFQDDLENGRMRFDFHLRTGVITKSNGLELMRSIGLKV